MDGFVKINLWISLNCFIEWYFDFSKLFHGFVKVATCIHGFVKDVTWIGQSCCCCCISCPLPNKTKSKFDQDFKACWSFSLILRCWMSQCTQFLGSIASQAKLVCNNYPSISQVVLEEAKIKEAPKLECPSTPAPSVEDIEKRLKVTRRVIIISISLIL